MTIVGHCPVCGAPIYSPTVWHGINPPPPTYTCYCRFQYRAPQPVVSPWGTDGTGDFWPKPPYTVTYTCHVKEGTS